MNEIATQQEIVANDDDKIIFYKNKISGNSLIDVVKHAALPETFTKNRRQCWISKELISNFISQIEEIIGVREFLKTHYLIMKQMLFTALIMMHMILNKIMEKNIQKYMDSVLKQ